MTCQRYREAVSALLDGEEPGVGPELLERHLLACSACRHWRDAATALTRAARVGPADDVPDLTAGILEAAAGRTRARNRRQVLIPRVALVAVALAQLAFGVSDLLADGTATHSIRELGSWDLALAIGFLVAARRPARAWGMVPLVAAVVGCLLLSSGVDLASGRVQLTRETIHVLEVAGMLLLWRLARTYGAGAGGGAPARAGDDSADSSADEVAAGRPGRRRGATPPAAIGRRSA